MIPYLSKNTENVVENFSELKKKALQEENDLQKELERLRTSLQIPKYQHSDEPYNDNKEDLYCDDVDGYRKVTVDKFIKHDQTFGDNTISQNTEIPIESTKYLYLKYLYGKDAKIFKDNMKETKETPKLNNIKEIKEIKETNTKINDLVVIDTLKDSNNLKDPDDRMISCEKVDGSTPASVFDCPICKTTLYRCLCRCLGPKELKCSKGHVYLYCVKHDKLIVINRYESHTTKFTSKFKNRYMGECLC